MGSPAANTRQLSSAARDHLVALAGRTGCLAGIEARAFVDIDSLLRPVSGHHMVAVFDAAHDQPGGDRVPVTGEGGVGDFGDLGLGTHRRHAIIETVFADLIDGPLAHLPSGRFAANSAWAICAGITHNLLRAAGTLSGERHGVARGATLRRRIVNVPARLARPQRRAVLHLPAHWPWAQGWNRLWDNVFTTGAAPPAAA